MKEMKQQKAVESSGTLLGEAIAFLLHDLKPPLRLSYVQLIAGFVFPGFIQPLRPCGKESLCANPSPAAFYAFLSPFLILSLY